LPQVQEPNGDQIADVAINSISHELSEAITDPLILTACGPPGNACGWYDAYSSTNIREIADQCVVTGAYEPANALNPYAYRPTLGGSVATGTLYDQLLAGHRWYNQAERSNAVGDCLLWPQTAPIAALSVSPSRAATGVFVVFDGSASRDPNGRGLPQFAFSFGDGASRSGLDEQAVHRYSRPGTYAVMLTVVDDLGLTATASQTITIVRARINRIKVAHKTRTGAVLTVSFNAPGTLFGIGKPRKFAIARSVRLHLKLSKAEQASLATAGHLRVKLKLKFVPQLGASFTKRFVLSF
jgi:PKD repeat protein